MAKRGNCYLNLVRAIAAGEGSPNGSHGLRLNIAYVKLKPSREKAWAINITILVSSSLSPASISVGQAQL